MPAQNRFTSMVLLVLAAASLGAEEPQSCTPAPVGGDAGPPPDAAPAPPCNVVGDTAAVVVATAGGADDFMLSLPAESVSVTRWSEPNNEAVILEVSGAVRGLIGHLVLHQGKARFGYTMHLGALAVGEAVRVKVSALSAASAQKSACLAGATLIPAATLGAAGEGLKNAPIFLWPVQKRFDDIPMLVGWSASKKGYQTHYSNENGGTIQLCGGGADGTQALLARWGRATDVEGMYTYGATASWMRCTGDVAPTAGAPRLEGAHPVFYYGSGHNKLFESRGGYGQACGTALPEKADGDLAGWNVTNPGNAVANDAGRVIILRPAPVALDSLGYATYSGRREGLADSAAPWLYRLSFAELAREGKIDGNLTLPMERYVFADVHVAGINGIGDRVCWPNVSGGFLLSAKTATTKFDGPQMTALFFGGADNWKRMAIPVSAGVKGRDIKSLVIDSLDNDGIYLLGVGDVFMVEPLGDNGASLVRAHQGETPLRVYIDDANLGCVGGMNNAGPGGTPSTCVGGAYEATL